MHILSRYSRFAKFAKNRKRRRAGMLSKLVGRSTKGRLVRAATLAAALTGAGAIAARRKGGITGPHSKIRRGLLGDAGSTGRGGSRQQRYDRFRKPSLFNDYDLWK